MWLWKPRTQSSSASTSCATDPASRATGSNTPPSSVAGRGIKDRAPRTKMFSAMAGRKSSSSRMSSSLAGRGISKRPSTAGKMLSSLAGRDRAGPATAAPSARPAHWPPYPTTQVPASSSVVRDFRLAYVKKVDEVELSPGFQTALSKLPDDDAMKMHLCEYVRVLIAQRFFGFEGRTAAIALDMIQNVSHTFGDDKDIVQAAYFLRNNVAGPCNITIGTRAVQLSVRLQPAGEHKDDGVPLVAALARKKITVFAAGSRT